MEKIIFLTLLLCSSLLPAQVSTGAVLAAAETALTGYRQNKTSGVHFQGTAYQTPSGFYVYYQPFWRGKPVWSSSQDTVHLNNKLQVTFIQSEASYEKVLAKVYDKVTAKKTAADHLSNEIAATPWTVDSITEGVWNYQTIAAEAFRIQLSATVAGSPLAYVVDVDAHRGVVANFFPLNRTYHQEGVGTVFRHNPVAGSGYSDGHSAATQEAALRQVPLRGLDASGLLRGDFVDVTAPGMSEHTYPSPFFSYHPGFASSSEGIFNFSPDDPAFEEVMVYYWIDSAQRYLQSLGYQIFDRPIPVDCHAFLGHNAMFLSSIKALAFGDGIVQSAEDASVIVHEYGHAILDAIVNGRFNTASGTFFHEGFADYFASVIARAQAGEVGTDLFPEFLGEWFVGNVQNEPPHLRTLLPPSFRYPALEIDPHSNGTLWSSSFYELDRQLPQNLFFPLLLEALHATPSAHPADVCEALFRADELLYQGRFHQQLDTVLRTRGLLHPEESHSIIEVQPGQIYQVSPGEAPSLYVHFQVPENTQRLVLDTPAANNMYLGIGRLPSRADNDLEVQTRGYLELSALSQPQLEPGRDYYVALSPYAQTTIELQLDGPSREPITTLAQGSTVQLPQSTRAKILIERESPAISEIELMFEGLENPLYLEMHPHKFDPAWNDDLSRYYLIPGGTTSYKIPVPPIYQNPGPLFCSLDSLELGGLNMSWRPSDPQIYPMAPNTAVIGQIGQDGTTLYDFIIEGENNLVIQTDTSHPFQLEYYGSEPISGLDNRLTSSFIMNGVHTQVLQRESPNFISSQVMLGHLYNGTYRCRVKGDVGSTFQISAHPDGFQMPDTFVQGGPQEFIIPSNGMKLITLHIPLDVYAFWIDFQNPVAGQSLNYHLLEIDGKVTPFTSYYGVEFYNTQNPQLRVTVDNWPRTYSQLTPGRDYQLWLYNSEDQDMNLSMTFGLENNRPTAPPLEDGSIIVQDWSVDSIVDSHYYVDAYTLSPPPDTKSVHLSFEHLQGGRDTTFYVKLANGQWGNFLLGDLRLNDHLLGFQPNRPFEIAFGTQNNFPPVEGPIKIKLHITYDAEKDVDQVYRTSGSSQAYLTSYNPNTSRFELPDPVRGIEFGWSASRMVPGERLRNRIERDKFAYDATSLEKYPLLNETESLFGLSDHLPLEGQFWTMQTYAQHSDHWTNFLDYAYPLDATLQTKFYPLATATRVAPVPSQAAATMVQRRLFAINPSAAALALNQDGSTHELPPGGFANLDLSAADAPHFSASSPIVLFEKLTGPNWTTLTAPSPYQDPKLLLPHLPPSSSPWLTLVSLAHDGAVSATLKAPTLSDREVQPGTSEFALRGEQDQAAWLQFQAGPESPNSLFGEDRLSGTQYWTLDGLFAAERAGLRPSQTLYVPHVPNLEDWWLGISLTNPSELSTTITVSAYGPDGTLLSQVHHFSLAGNSTRTGLLESFYPFPTTRPAWLRIQSDQFPVMGLGFIGNKRQSGIDVACYGLPSVPATRQLLPGAMGGDWFGLALVNPLDQDDMLTLEAVGPSGLVLATTTRNIGPRHKELVIGSQVFFAVTGPYYLRISSQQGRTLALQLDGTALSLQAGIPIP